MAYDRAKLLLEGSGGNLLSNCRFEGGTAGWLATASSAFPAMSLYLGTWGRQSRMARPAPGALAATPMEMPTRSGSTPDPTNATS